MEACLVMKNNLKRVVVNRYTYIIMVLIPLLLTIASLIGNGIQQKTIRVGILHPTNEIVTQLEQYSRVQYETTDAKTAKTNLIMGQYQYLIDGEEKEELQGILAEIENMQNELDATVSKVTATKSGERFIAMLLTAYFVIATVYTSKFIQDREQGMLLRVQAAGVKKRTYLLGYALSTGIISVIQIGIAMFGFSLFSKDFRIEVGKMVMMIVIMSIIVTIYAIGHALFCKREMTANIMASSIAVVLSILGGTFVAVEQMPRILQTLSIISPIRWVMMLL